MRTSCRRPTSSTRAFARGVRYALALVVVTDIASRDVGYHELADIRGSTRSTSPRCCCRAWVRSSRSSSVAGKVFDSIYALFCGIILLAATGLLFAPVLHRILHRFHIEDAA